MAAALNKKLPAGDELTASYLYTVVNANRHCIQDTLFQSRGLTTDHPKRHQIPVDIETSSGKDSADESGREGSKNAKSPGRTFTIKLTSLEWSKTTPVRKHGKRRDSLVFPAGSYEDIIVEANWDQNRIPCPFAFKLSYVYTGPTATYYAKFDAYCLS